MKKPDALTLKVAKAICRADGHTWSFALKPTDWTPSYLKLARAAIRVCKKEGVGG